MGPQSEGRPSGDERTYGSPLPPREDSRFLPPGRELDTNLQGQRQGRPGAAGYPPDSISPTSPAVSAGGREKDGDPPKSSGERERSRNRVSRRASGQLRVCKKCGEPLTGQFVRALGGTFHLDCFKCKVSRRSLET